MLFSESVLLHQSSPLLYQLLTDRLLLTLLRHKVTELCFLSKTTNTTVTISGQMMLKVHNHLSDYHAMCLIFTFVSTVLYTNVNSLYYVSLMFQEMDGGFF